MKKKWGAAALSVLLSVAMAGGCAGDGVGNTAAKNADQSTENAAQSAEDAQQAEKTAGKSLDEIMSGRKTEAISCHDPQILLAQDGRYYMFGSHMVGASSDTLSGWEYFANGNNLFDNLFDGDLDAFAFVGKNTDGGYSVWAPNVIYNETMQKYVMYFCTTSSYIKSNLCFAVADEPQGQLLFQLFKVHRLGQQLIPGQLLGRRLRGRGLFPALGGRLVRHGGHDLLFPGRALHILHQLLGAAAAVLRQNILQRELLRLKVHIQIVSSFGSHESPLFLS